MSLEQPSDLELAILEHLATYRFLTNKQLLTLGVSKSEKHLQMTLRSMAGLHTKPRVTRAGEGAVARKPTRYRPYRSPAVKVFIFGLDKSKAIRGRMPYVYALTRQGAELLASLRGDETPPYAPAVPSFPRQEYLHRLGIIDCHIAVRTWAQLHSARLDFYHVEFTRSRKPNGRSVTDTRVELKDGSFIKPDSIFQLTTSDERKRLYALEFAAGLETALIESKLDTYRYVLHEGAIRRAFAYEHGVRVLVVFKHESTLRNVFERLASRSEFRPFSRHFVFKTLEELERDVVWLAAARLARSGAALCQLTAQLRLGLRLVLRFMLRYVLRTLRQQNSL